jgi:hypothetical protein
MAFKATWYSGSLIDLSSNGASLSMVDHSNYDGEYTDQATGGAATYVDLPVGASTHNDFYKNLECAIVSGTGAGGSALCTAYNGTTRRLTVASWPSGDPDATSVVQIGERGHLQKYFADFRKIVITAPSEVWTLSSLGDGDAATVTPDGQTLPITDTYAISDGDAVYRCKLYVLPTWDATTAYLYVNKPYVYHSGMWKLLKNDTGTTPGTDATVWAEITDIDNLGTRYIADNRIVSYCDLMACWRQKVAAAAKPCNICNAELMIRDMNVQRALQLSLIKDAIPVLAAKGWWTSSDNVDSNVTDLINYGREICCCST